MNLNFLNDVAFWVIALFTLALVIWAGWLGHLRRQRKQPIMLDG